MEFRFSFGQTIGVYLPPIVDANVTCLLVGGGHARYLAPFLHAGAFTTEGLGHGLVRDLERPRDRARGHSKAA